MPGTRVEEQRLSTGRATRVPLVRVALAWALGVALLVWLTRGVEWHRLGAALRSAPWWAWTGAVAGLLGSYLLRALRIHAEIGARHRATVSQCLGVMLLHNSAVNLVPMRGGEAAYPWLMHRRLGVPLAQATASLVWMRLQDVIVLSLLVLGLWPGIPAGLRLACAAGLLAAVAAGLRVLERLAARSAARGPKLVRAAHAALQALALAPRHGWRGWLYCGSSWTLKLLVLGGLLAALSGVSAIAGTTGALGGELAAVMPLQGPANLGTYEAGVWLGASVGGRAPPEIVAAAIAVHLLSLATAVASGAVAWAVSQRRGQVSPAPTEARTP